MAIITLRLNEEEEKVLDLLVKYLNEDKSKILKEAMWDRFEELRDRELIEAFEARSRAGKVQFESADDLVLKVEEKKTPYSVGYKAPGPSRKRGRKRKG